MGRQRVWCKVWCQLEPSQKFLSVDHRALVLSDGQWTYQYVSIEEKQTVDLGAHGIESRIKELTVNKQQIPQKVGSSLLITTKSKPRNFFRFDFLGSGKNRQMHLYVPFNRADYLSSAILVIVLCRHPMGCRHLVLDERNFQVEEKKTYTEKRKNPPPAPNTLCVILVRGWVGVQKGFRPPPTPWTSYMTKSCWSGWGLGSKKVLHPCPPLNILHDQVMLVKGWVGVWKVSNPHPPLNIIHDHIMLVM